MMSNLSSRAGELKSQGAIEAAQDPGSKVGAQDAENILEAESKKAGVAAMQFDPNATPEEKAAQARAVRPTLHTYIGGEFADYRVKRIPKGFHHESKPKAVKIATDIVKCPFSTRNGPG